jgi:antibiotic biosynthesis monooxygenase (ABM) superfamily enzyme
MAKQLGEPANARQAGGMTSPSAAPPNRSVAPPTKHQLALMIWIAVFPTLSILNLALGELLQDLPIVVRTLVLATAAVPIVIYGLMPYLHRARIALISRRSAA